MKQLNFLSGAKKSLAVLGLVMGISSQAEAVTINGTVYNDANRNFTFNTGESFTSLPAPLYVHLVSPTRIVLASTAVAANGTYSVEGTYLFNGNPSGGQYLVILSTQQYANGFDAGVSGDNINTTPPTGYATVGEQTPIPPNNDGANGILRLSLNATQASGIIDNNNFGIACKRAGNNISEDRCIHDRSISFLEQVVYEYMGGDLGGTWTYQSGSGFTFDAAAGTIQATSAATNSVFRYTVTGVAGCPSSYADYSSTIKQASTRSQIVTICAGDSVCIFNPAMNQRVINPQGRVCYTTAGTYVDTLLAASANGCDSVVTTTVNVNPLSATSCGGTANITGRVFNDANNNTIIDGATEHFASLPATLYIYLVNSDNIVVGAVPVNANGTYTIPARPNTTYTLKLSAQQYPLGTKVTTTPINTTPPTGWATTGENGANNTGSGDGTPDGSLSVTTDPYGASNKNFGIKESGALPMNLLSFEAVKAHSGVQLNWITIAEENNKGFEIERSTNGSKWSVLGWVNSNNSSEKSTYSYADNSPLYGSNFYRLKQTDIDGRYEYSPVRVLNFGGNAITVAPNPATESVTIANLAGNETIVLFDVMGRTLLNTKAAAGAVSLDLSNFASGVYHIRIADANGAVSIHKLVKQ